MTDIDTLIDLASGTSLPQATRSDAAKALCAECARRYVASETDAEAANWNRLWQMAAAYMLREAE